MTNHEQLAADIAKVMDLDAKRTQGSIACVLDGTDFALVGQDSSLIGIIFRQNGEIGEIGSIRHGESRNGNYLAAAPLMADIIRRQQDVMQALAHALQFYADFEDNTDGGAYQTHEYGDPMEMMTLDEGYTAQQALALVAPLLKEK